LTSILICYILYPNIFENKTTKIEHMKKTIFSLLMVSTVLLIQASPATNLVTLISDSIFYNGAHTQTLNTGTSWNYSHWYLYKKTTDTTMYHSDTMVGSGTVFLHYLKKLQPNTSYYVWSVIKNGGLTDTSNTSITITTKGVPAPPSMSVVNILRLLYLFCSLHILLR
jgi:hypothetical protein